MGPTNEGGWIWTAPSGATSYNFYWLAVSNLSDCPTTRTSDFSTLSVLNSDLTTIECGGNYPGRAITLCGVFYALSKGPWCASGGTANVCLFMSAVNSAGEGEILAAPGVGGSCS